MKPRLSSEARTAALAFAAVLLATFAFFLSPLRERLDLFVLDATARMVRLSAPRDASDEVVIVGIDERTEQAIPEPFAMWHAHLGRALASIASARPRLVALDVVLPDRSYDEIRPGLDAALVAGLSAAKRAAPLVLGIALDVSGRPRPVHPLLLATVGSGSLGFAYALADADGVARRVATATATLGDSLPSLAERAAGILGSTPDDRPVLIDFACGEPFGYVSLATVLGWNDEAGRQSARAAFADKIVLLGSVTPDADPVRQPLSLAAWDAGASDPPGVVLHAQSIRALRSGCRLEELDKTLMAGIVAVGALVFFVPAAAMAWAVSVAGIVGLLALTGLAYLSGFHFPPAAPAAAVVIAAAMRSLLDARDQRRARQAIENRFAGYVSPELLEAIKRGGIDADNPRKHDRLAFLFADIRGFTTMSEREPAGDVVALLNRYYDKMAPAIHRFEGAIDNFRGDGIMVIFGAFGSAADPARSAVEAAREMFRRLGEMNAELAAEGKAPVAIGIGIASGAAVVGNVGSAERHDFTAIGDAVNVAARLQSCCKSLGMRLIVSDAVAKSVPDGADWQPLGALDLAGHTPVSAYGWPADPEC